MADGQAEQLLEQSVDEIPDFIVLRPGAEAPPGFFPEPAGREWLDRRYLRIRPGRNNLNSVPCEIRPANRFETRDDGALAEVWEVVPITADTPEIQWTDAELHRFMGHPDWEYTTTNGPRKAWYEADVPPEGDGWELNVDVAEDGKVGGDDTETVFWRRRRAQGDQT